jgi:hypothetical protein
MDQLRLAPNESRMTIAFRQSHTDPLTEGLDEVERDQLWHEESCGRGLGDRVLDVTLCERLKITSSGGGQVHKRISRYGSGKYKYLCTQLRSCRRLFL